MSGLWVTAVTCRAACAIGAPMGFAVAITGAAQMRSPATGLRTFAERKSL